MTDHDSMREVLREWKAPEPPTALDDRMRTAYRAAYRPSPWRSFGKRRISVPAPVLAALVLLALALFLEFRFRPAPVPPRAEPGYVTRMEATGFQPLPNGAARVVRAEGHQ